MLYALKFEHKTGGGHAIVDAPFKDAAKAVLRHHLETEKGLENVQIESFVAEVDLEAGPYILWGGKR
jgi:hypothetical protein